MFEGRPRLEIVWAALVVAYGALRVLVVTLFFRRYGVNPYVFAGVELTSSLLYGVASGRLVTALLSRDRPSITRWGPLSVAGFVAPDLLVVATARRVPITIYGAFGIVIITTSTLAIRAIRRQAET